MFSGNVPLAAFVSRGARSVADTPTFTFGADDLELIETGTEGCVTSQPQGPSSLLQRPLRIHVLLPLTTIPRCLPRPRPCRESVQLLTHVAADDESGTRQPALEAAIAAYSQAGSGSGGLCVGLAETPGDGFELTPLDQNMVVQQHAALILPHRRGEEPTWPAGSLRFYSFDPESCRLDLTRRLTDLKAHAEAKGDRLLGAVMFTCAG